MIRSMTAFSRIDINAHLGNAYWELRSVNQRYLETNIKLPEQFRSIEQLIRDKIKKKITRGKVECFLRLDLNVGSEQKLVLNNALASQLINAACDLKEKTQCGDFNIMDILSWPGVLKAQEYDLDEISQLLMQKFDHLLNNFIKVRETEGQALAKLIESRLNEMEAYILKIKAQMPLILKWQKEKLLEKFAEAKITLDNQRIEQELILLAQKLDVAEELDRLTLHINETKQIIIKDEAVGRRLDFMMQEFNRETNTIASKSINAEITKYAVELKVLIEQIREQIQNIE